MASRNHDKTDNATNSNAQQGDRQDQRPDHFDRQLAEMNEKFALLCARLVNNAETTADRPEAEEYRKRMTAELNQSVLAHDRHLAELEAMRYDLDVEDLKVFDVVSQSDEEDGRSNSGGGESSGNSGEGASDRGDGASDGADSDNGCGEGGRTNGDGGSESGERGVGVDNGEGISGIITIPDELDAIAQARRTKQVSAQLEETAAKLDAAWDRLEQNADTAADRAEAVQYRARMNEKLQQRILDHDLRLVDLEGLQYAIDMGDLKFFGVALQSEEEDERSSGGGEGTRVNNAPAIVSQDDLSDTTDVVTKKRRF